MYPTKQGNTQVYSPLGSFVVEQHDQTGRHDTIKRRYKSDAFRSEKVIAISWLLVLMLLAGGSIYNRLGRPDIVATTQAEAASTRSPASVSNVSQD